MRDRFARLLSEFLALAGRRRTTRAPRQTRIQALLEGFAQLRKLVVPREQAQAADDHETIRALLIGYSKAVKRYRRQQEKTADDFNLLDVMQLTGKEIRHSRVLAWLVDHDIRKQPQRIPRIRVGASGSRRRKSLDLILLPPEPR